MKGKKHSEVLGVGALSAGVVAMMRLLDRLDALVDETPPLEDKSVQRFGNKAFKEWHAKMMDESDGLLKSVLPNGKEAGSIELAGYLNDGFGNSTRLDYGSGHELAFVALLCCLSMLGAFGEADLPALGLTVFGKYLTLTRRLQRTYKLEPAGSHGVWGLDDHQFLPYFWGSSQLVGGDGITTPADIGRRETANEHAEENLFFGAIQNIFAVKTGPFFEHSRYLFDMSSIPEWKKINSGLLKMFDAEVLYKFPVIQHFLFGSLLPIELPKQPAVPVTGFPGAPPGFQGHGIPLGRAPWAE